MNKQFRSRLRSYAIFLLLALAVVQTAGLWADESDWELISEKVTATLSPESQTETAEATPIAPSTLVAGSGDRRYSLIYGQKEQQNLLSSAFRVITSAIAEGSLTESTAKDLSLVLEGPCVLLNYAADIGTEEYVKGFAGKGTALLQAMDSFSAVAVLPSPSGGEDSRVVFINNSTEQMSIFTAPDRRSASDLNTLLDRYVPQSGMSYISAAQSGMHLFSEDTFLPQWEADYTYPLLSHTNAFIASAGESLIRPLQSFFSNFGSVSRELTENGGFLLSDKETVVHYYPTGILEYYNYASDKSRTPALAQAYTLCTDFLNSRDAMLTADYYLADLRLDSEGWTFYFDYAYGGFPLLIDETILQELGLSHAMEVVVSGSSVRKYKRLAYEFTAAEATAAVEGDFLSVLESLWGAAGGSITQVDHMGLGYRIDRHRDSSLNWQVVMNNAVYLQETLKE